jgi:hypothetical protein
MLYKGVHTFSVALDGMNEMLRHPKQKGGKEAKIK